MPVEAKRMVETMSREGAFLFLVCLLDALSTYVFLQLNIAREGNPLLASVASGSPGLFLCVKLLTFVPAIGLAEWYRRINPSFVRRGLRLAAAIYLSVYGIMVLPQLLLH
jgi:Domain of unknown function (DUF5658)